MSARIVLIVLAAVISWVAPADARKLKVVATFSILGDIVERIGGDRVEVRTLVGPDADAHVFEATSADARAVAQADVVFSNGLGFDPWINKLVKASGSKATVVAVADSISPKRKSKGGAIDPHAWHDPNNVLTYANQVARTLAAAEANKPDGSFYFVAVADYHKELERLDSDILAAMRRIPKERRRVITSHDAFGHFAAAFEVEFIAPLGVSTEAQASAKGVARLIDQIKREKIRAVFVENITDPRLIEQIARETGAKIGGKLYSDALSTKAGPAPTYLAMMRHNVRLLTAAMAPGL